MPATAEAKVLNEAIWASLEKRSDEEKARNAVDGFWRCLMYHKFTGMPKRGMMARILPPRAVKTKAEWLSLGVLEADLRKTSYVKQIDLSGNVVHMGGDQWEPWWYTGQLFYEIAESRLEREDYERRLAAREVSKSEWKIRDRCRRRLARWDRERPENAGLTDRIEKFAYNVMGQIAAMIGPRENSW